MNNVYMTTCVATVSVYIGKETNEKNSGSVSGFECACIQTTCW
jgi:hypothetical protein